MSSVAFDDIKVEFDGEEIVVWKPGTVFLVAFKKAPDQQRLLVTRSWLAGFASKPLAEFRALAAQRALDKAYSLGWAVQADVDPKKSRRRAKLLRLLHKR